MTLSDRQIRAIHAKGTLPVRAKRSGYDIERLVGTDTLIVRKHGESKGIITTRDDLGRVIKNIEQQKKMEKLISDKLENTRRRSKLTDAQLRQIQTMQEKMIFG